MTGNKETVAIPTIFQNEIEAMDKIEGLKVPSDGGFMAKNEAEPNTEAQIKTEAALSVNTEAEYDWQRQDMMENPEERVPQVEKKQKLSSAYLPPPSLNKMGFSNSMLAKIRAEVQ